MMTVIWLMRAMVLRAYFTTITYRFALGLRWVNTFVQLVVLFFMAKLLNSIDPSFFPGSHSSSYVEFLIIGGLPMMVLGTSMFSVTKDVKLGQAQGTLELFLTSPVRLGKLMFATTCFQHVLLVVKMVLSLLIVSLIVEIRFENMDLLMTVLILLLTSVCFTGLGLVSAGFLVAFKRGDPVQIVIGLTFTLFGNMVIPVTMLPPWLQAVPPCLPISYATNGIRYAILEADKSWVEFMPYAQGLAIFSAVFLPLGFFTFSRLFNRARREGTLSQY